MPELGCESPPRVPHHIRPEIENAYRIIQTSRAIDNNKQPHNTTTTNIPVTHQGHTLDCGIHAIANGTAWLHGYDPSKMRTHLLSWFDTNENYKATMFPHIGTLPPRIPHWTTPPHQ